MKLVVLSDIHANLPALEQVLEDIEEWCPDQVVVGGDVVNRGPRSRECLAIIRQKVEKDGWYALRGNHEDYIIAQSKPDSPRRGPLAAAFQSSYWTYLNIDRDVSAIASWPVAIQLELPPGRVARIAHASVDSNQHGVFPFTTDEELSRQVGQPPPTLFCTAHTHFPLVKVLEETLVVNVGAVGMPFDSDWRACYARLTFQQGGWHEQIIRLPYDRERCIQDYDRTGYLEEGGPLTWLILAELLYARPQLFEWHRKYFRPVSQGLTSMQASVRDQLERQGIWDELSQYVG